MHRTLLSLPACFLLVAFPHTSRAEDPSMESLWPSADGARWEYHQTYEEAGGGLQADNTAFFTFRGTDVVPGGVEVQNLEVEIVGDVRPFSESITDPLLASLWRARPDLREAISARAKRDPGIDDPPDGFYQVFLHAAAFRKTPGEVASWRRDLESTRSWLWLVSDLTIGNEFVLQLVPDLADNVFLHGVIAAWEAVDVPAGHFPNCLRVDYRIDFGETICTNDEGEATGAARTETRGFVHYSPDTGPIDSHEEWLLAEIIWGECVFPFPPGERITWGSLELVKAGPVPTRQTSWGALKARYVPEATR